MKITIEPGRGGNSLVQFTRKDDPLPGTDAVTAVELDITALNDLMVACASRLADLNELARMSGQELKLVLCVLTGMQADMHGALDGLLKSMPGLLETAAEAGARAALRAARDTS